MEFFTLHLTYIISRVRMLSSSSAESRSLNSPLMATLIRPVSSDTMTAMSIGSNDLTMLVLGCDRDNDTVSHIYDERNLAVRRAVRHLIEVAHSEGKTVSICGQAPSVYPEFCEFLIKSGIDSISVNPDTVKFTKKLVAQVEQRVMLDALTGRGRKEVEELDWK